MQNSFTLNSASVTDRGLSTKRPQNEDSFIEIPSKGIFAVADGVGGGQSGEVASQMAMEVLQDAFVNYHEGLDVETLMKTAIEQANTSIHQMSRELPNLATMATTIVALHLEGNIATIGHVGDSRLYRLDSQGNLFRETQDHSLVEDELRAGAITPAQAENHPQKNVISRALGSESTVEVDLKTIMVDAHTTFLLCSDGITRHLSDHEIRELLLTCNSPLDSCREMKNLCFSRGAEDNLTAVTVKIEGNGNPDFDETTISRPRIPFVGQEQPVVKIESEAVANRWRPNISTESSQLSIPAQARPESAMFRMEDGSGSASDDDVRQYETLQSERSQIIQSSQKGLIGRLISWVFLLGFGGLLGAAGMFFYMNLTRPAATVPSPQIIQPIVNPQPVMNSNSNVIANANTKGK
jgi:PPM family protein phosphatase